MSSDDEFDDLFSFSTPAKTDASNNANDVDSDATKKATSEDDFLDDVFGTEDATTTAVTDTDDSFLDIFDSPPPTKAAGTVATDDIEAEFDLLTADAGVAPASANTEVATTAAAAPSATSVHVDSAQPTIVDRSTGNMTAQEKSRGDLTTATAAASAASGEAANDDSVPSTLEPAADKTPLIASAEEVNMNMNEDPSTGGNPVVSLTDTTPSLDATVAKELVLSEGNDTSSAPSPTPAPGPSGQASAEVSAPPSPTPSPAVQPRAKHTNASSVVVEAPPTTTLSDATLLHDDVHAHDAETQEMLNFLADSDNTEADKAGSVVPSLPVDHSPSSDALRLNPSFSTNYAAPSVNDDDANKSPMALSSTGEAAVGIDRTHQELQSEGLNQTEEDSAFDFEKDILGVIPIEEEMAEEKTKQGKEKKAASQTETEEAAPDKTLRNTTDISTSDAKSEGSDTSKRTPPRAAIMAGNTSSVRLPNLTIPSKLSNPLRRKDRAQGGTEGPAPLSSDCESSSTRMGSFLHSIKVKAAASTGGSDSNDIERAVATSAKEVSDCAAAAAVAAAPATSNPKKTFSPPKISAPPKFETLGEAVRSTKSTPSLIADLFKDEQEKSMRAAGWTIADTDRAALWVKIVTGKTMEEVANGSLVDSFIAWDEQFNLYWNAEIMNHPTPSHDALQVDLSLLEQVRCESKQLAHDVNRMQFEGRDSFERNLCSIVLFHHRSMAKDPCTTKKTMGYDSYLTGVVAVLLAAPLPPPVASIVLASLFSSTLPLMGLDDTPFPAEDEVRAPHQSERSVAVCALHEKLYCLATYHLPLLVTHLDRHCPSWWMPASMPPDASEEMASTSDTSTARKSSESVLEFNASGRHHRHKPYVPSSWFVTHCVGTPGTENLDLYQIILIWDSFLASGDSSFIFFLALAILEASSDDLLMLQGELLGRQVYNLLTFCVENGNTSEDGASNEAGQGHEPSNANATMMKIKDWTKMAMLLEQSTPKSVVKDLGNAEVVVVDAALKRRRELAAASLKGKLEAEAREKRRQRQDDAKRALLKTRLIQYYRRQAPDKVDSVDRILEVYEGRYDVLDSNLRRKYGTGFLPTISVNPQLSASTSKLLSSVKDQKAKIAQKIESAAQRQKNRGDGDEKKQDDSDHVSDIGVAVRVEAAEVIPIICGVRKTPSKDLKFILVDCRPEPSQNEGRFATSVSASSLTDIEKLETLDVQFESVRGTVHIVVMGEGFSAYPLLYHHQLSRNEFALAREDHARVQNCAHFFIKRGYPFVSILDGGFAAAHAWLSRHSTDSDPDSDPLTPSSVLLNYDPARSTVAKMAAKMERPPSAERIQEFFDSSMTVLTNSERSIEKRYVAATQKLMNFPSIGSSGKDGRAHACAEENASQGEEEPTAASSIGLVDEKKEDSSAQSNVAAMKIRFSSFSSSVNAVAAGDSSETNPSTSLKRISDALGQAKKTFPQSSSSQASLKISNFKRKITSNMRSAAKNNSHDIEQESITFHVEEE